MKDKEFVFLFSNNKNLLEISNGLKHSFHIDLNNNYIELIKILLENKEKKIHLITNNSIKAEVFTLALKLINKNLQYSIWFEEIKNISLSQKLLELPVVYFSESLITRSNQMKHSLNLLYKKRVFVIYPWIKESGYIQTASDKVKTNYNLITNYDIKLPKNWKETTEFKNADISIIKLKDRLLNFKLPQIIINSIESRTPTIIIYHKPKTVNKIFKYVKNIHVIASENDLDFYHLEYLANQSYKFKIPKKLRFNYNLTNFKKFLK